MNTSGFYENSKLKNYYSILQIDRNAEPEVISFAYKALAKKNHPDLGGTAERMKLINEAYDVLNDAVSKDEYDKLYDAEKKEEPKAQGNESSMYKDNSCGCYKESGTEYCKTDNYHKPAANQCKPEGREEGIEDSDSGRYSADDIIKKVLEENLSDNTYEVLVKGHDFTIPWTCVCCLGKPQHKLKVKYKFNKNEALSNAYKFIYANFPICRECRKHIREFLIKRSLLFTVSLLSGIMTILWLVFQKVNISWSALMAIGSVITIISIFLLNLLLELSPLEDKHADRDKAVNILDCNENGIMFRFDNWYYAELFAKNNNTQAIPIEGKKYGRERFFLKGKFAVQTVATILLLWIAIIAVVGICIKPIEEMWRELEIIKELPSKTQTGELFK